MRCMDGSGLSISFLHKKITVCTSFCHYSDFSLLKLHVLFFHGQCCGPSENYKLSFNNSLTAASSPFTVSGNIGNTFFTISTVRDV